MYKPDLRPKRGKSCSSALLWWPWTAADLRSPLSIGPTARLSLSAEMVAATNSQMTNEYKYRGVNTPIENAAEPAPTTQTVRAPEDDKPWTKADDAKLIHILAERPFEMLSDENKPWTVIATKCNFGHNSGSCKARWKILAQEKDKYASVKSVQFGGKVLHAVNC